MRWRRSTERRSIAHCLPNSADDDTRLRQDLGNEVELGDVERQDRALPGLLGFANRVRVGVVQDALTDVRRKRGVVVGSDDNAGLLTLCVELASRGEQDDLDRRIAQEMRQDRLRARLTAREQFGRSPEPFGHGQAEAPADAEMRHAEAMRPRNRHQP